MVSINLKKKTRVQDSLTDESQWVKTSNNNKYVGMSMLSSATSVIHYSLTLSLTISLWRHVKRV